MNRSLRKAILGLSVFLLFTHSTAIAQTCVVIKKGIARRYDAKTGAYKGSVGTSGAIAASSDGETIAIISKTGCVRCYAANGAYKGQVGNGKAVGVQVTGGMIIVTTETALFIAATQRPELIRGRTDSSQRLGLNLLLDAGDLPVMDC